MSYLENMPIRYCPSITLHGNPGSIGLNSPLTAEAVRARSFVNKDILLAHSISFKDLLKWLYRRYDLSCDRGHMNDRDRTMTKLRSYLVPYRFKLLSVILSPKTSKKPVILKSLPRSIRKNGQETGKVLGWLIKRRVWMSIQIKFETPLPSPIFRYFHCPIIIINIHFNQNGH